MTPPFRATFLQPRLPACQRTGAGATMPGTLCMASPLIGIIMGSASDWPTMQAAATVLDAAGVAYEARVVSAHRTPHLLFEYASAAAGRGLRCLIAGAGGAAHLPGMAAAITPLPVLGVPVRSRVLDGLDSLLSIVQMPAGIPVAAFRIGPKGAADAASFALKILRQPG